MEKLSLIQTRVGLDRISDFDDGHEALLRRLKGITHTGARKNFTKAHGLKLEANLKQAAP